MTTPLATFADRPTVAATGVAVVAAVGTGALAARPPLLASSHHPAIALALLWLNAAVLF